MPGKTLIYASSNGDVWSLVEEAESPRMLVRHQPNQASGGTASLTPLAQFLAEGHGPQHEALLRLIGEAKHVPAKPGD